MGFAAMVSGIAAKEGEDDKEIKYREVVSRTVPRPTFIPLALEIGETWGDRAMDFFREAVRRKGAGSQSEQAAFLGYWMRRFSVRFAAGVATVMMRRWARFSGRSYAAGELEFGSFYAETGVAPGTAPPPGRLAARGG